MAGGTEPSKAQAVVRETLNYASEKGGKIGCWLRYHPLLLYFLLLFTDKQMSTFVGSFAGGHLFKLLETGRAVPSFLFSASFHTSVKVCLHLCSPVWTEGHIGKMLSLLTKMYVCSRADDTWKPALGGYEACCIDSRTDKDHPLSHLHWAMRSEGRC